MDMFGVGGCRRVVLAGALLVLAASASAEQRTYRMEVSARVLSGHQPALVGDLPAMPLPGHVLQEDVRGVHYFYDGSLAAARAHYRKEMVRGGFRLRSESAAGQSAHEMLWERSGETALVQLRAATGLAPTRISVRMMGESSVAAAGVRK
jgi:hypothetical protein